MTDVYLFPVYATQGGGLAKRQDATTFVFIEAPEDFPDLKTGDVVPEEWDLVPVNRAARRIENDEQFGTEMTFGQLLDVMVIEVGRLKA